MESTELSTKHVSTIMSSELICVKESDSLLLVDELFEKHDIHHIPVVNDDSKLVGIISIKDILLLKDWGSKYNLDKANQKNESLLKSKLASELMSKEVFVVSPETSLSYCADVLRENRFHSLPVVQNDKLVGIVTTYDLINCAFGD